VLIQHRSHRDTLESGIGKARVPCRGGSAHRRCRLASLALVMIAVKV